MPICVCVWVSSVRSFSGTVCEIFIWHIIKFFNVNTQALTHTHRSRNFSLLLSCHVNIKHSTWIVKYPKLKPLPLPCQHHHRVQAALAVAFNNVHNIAHIIVSSHHNIMYTVQHIFRALLLHKFQRDNWTEQGRSQEFYGDIILFRVCSNLKCHQTSSQKSVSHRKTGFGKLALSVFFGNTCCTTTCNLDSVQWRYEIAKSDGVMYSILADANRRRRKERHSHLHKSNIYTVYNVYTQ